MLTRVVRRWLGLFTSGVGLAQTAVFIAVTLLLSRPEIAEALGLPQDLDRRAAAILLLVFLLVSAFKALWDEARWWEKRSTELGGSPNGLMNLDVSSRGITAVQAPPGTGATHMFVIVGLRIVSREMRPVALKIRLILRNTASGEPHALEHWASEEAGTTIVLNGNQWLVLPADAITLTSESPQCVGLARFLAFGDPDWLDESDAVLEVEDTIRDKVVRHSLLSV